MERRIYRSRKNRMIAGVCGGIAEYLNIDPAIVRLIMALLVFANGLGLILYILAVIIIPEKPEESGSSETTPHIETHSPITLGIILIIIGIVAIIWTAGIPWLHWLSPGVFIGILILIAGLYFLIRGWK
ncbi:MAG: PspC domain-containing protein [bacterium]|nr:PspC domain-containing protein [bacterium]